MEHTNEMETELEKGYKLIRIQRATEMVKLSEIDENWLPYLHEEAHLLSLHLQHERTLLYLLTEELFSIFSTLKEENIIEEKLLHILETILLGMDYLTHERLVHHPFEAEDKANLLSRLSELFLPEKTHAFSDCANRPLLNKSKLYLNDEGVYAKDEREKRTRIYAVILYKKPINAMEHFRQVVFQLMSVQLKPNTSNVSHEDMLQGMTDCELHTDTLLYLNLVQRTLSWFVNSASWRHNELFTFDELDLRSKLSLR